MIPLKYLSQNCTPLQIKCALFSTPWELKSHSRYSPTYDPFWLTPVSSEPLCNCCLGLWGNYWKLDKLFLLKRPSKNWYMRTNRRHLKKGNTFGIGSKYAKIQLNMITASVNLDHMQQSKFTKSFVKELPQLVRIFIPYDPSDVKLSVFRFSKVY